MTTWGNITGSFEHGCWLCPTGVPGLNVFHANTLQHERKQNTAQPYSVGWGRIYLCIMLCNNQTHTHTHRNLSFDSKTAEYSRHKAFFSDSKTSAHPHCLAEQTGLLFPLTSAPPLSFPLFHSSGSDNSAQSQPSKKGFWVCFCLFNLAALWTRQPVSALIHQWAVHAFHVDDVCALSPLHSFKSNGCTHSCWDGGSARLVEVAPTKTHRWAITQHSSVQSQLGPSLLPSMSAMLSTLLTWFSIPLWWELDT